MLLSDVSDSRALIVSLFRLIVAVREAETKKRLD